MNPVTVALVGCGGIAQQGYLPAMALASGVQCRWLVDANLALAKGLAGHWKIPGASDQFDAVLEQVEAVIVAVPNHLHAPLSIRALERGKAVLCEKPLARTAEEARAMAEAAARANKPLAAGMIFRQFPGFKRLRAECPWERLGTVREVRAAFGHPLDWPLASPYLFDKERAGGGALLDQGVHVLDALQWVLQWSDVAVSAYQDDGDSGVEAEALIELTARLPHQPDRPRCRVEVSRLRHLANTIEIIGGRASLILPIASDAPPVLHEAGRRAPVWNDFVPASGTRCFVEQLEAFALTVRGQPAVYADGESQVTVLGLIAACYAMRRPLVFGWSAYAPWSSPGGCSAGS